MTNFSNDPNLKAFLRLSDPVKAMAFLAALFLYAAATIAICYYVVKPVFDFIRAHSGLSEYPGIVLAAIVAFLWFAALMVLLNGLLGRWSQRA